MPGEVPWAIVPVSKKHERDSFDCGVAELDEYLRRYARQSEEQGFGRTHVAVYPGENRVLGYFMLRTGEFDVSLLPEETRRRFPRYAVPVVHLARLAVDRSVQGQGLGEELLLTALQTALDISRRAGAFAVEVLAISEGAKSFYVHYGFHELADDPLHLYLRMSLVASLLAEE